jgi:signal transduction histidine kinase
LEKYSKLYADEAIDLQSRHKDDVKTRSLIRQAVGIVLTAQVLCAVALCGAALLHEWHTRIRAFDTRLEGRSDSLLGAIQDAEDPDDNVAIDPAELRVPKNDVYAVYNQGGRLLGSSTNAPSMLIERGKDQFRDVRVNGSSYRVLQREALRVIDRGESDGVGLRRPVTILYASPEGQVWHQILEAARFYLIAITLSAIATVSLVGLLLRLALRPLSDLVQAAASLSAPALEFEAPSSAIRVRELRPLADVLTNSVARLRESFAKEHRFVGDAAHELKTATAVIRSSVQLLMLKKRTGDEYSAGLNRILQDTQRLEGLVGQMLQLARLEEGRIGNLAPLDLGTVVDSVAVQLKPIADTRGLEIQVQSCPDCFVKLTPEFAEILVSNLLLNAIQHSMPCSPVSLCVARISLGRIRLEVADRGDGIGPEDLPHIFERFYREDRSRSRDTGGSGLGLALCKSVVEAAGGTIEVESTRNVGTRVQVTFSAA